jgi:hypothetical protein
MIEKRTSASSEPISEATTFDFQDSQKVLLLFITTQVVFKNSNLRCKSIRTNIRACYRARIHPIFLICEAVGWVAIGGCEYHG